MEERSLKIAIIGAGNVGVAMAADLTIAGHEVTLIKSSSSQAHSLAFSRLQGENKPLVRKDDKVYVYSKLHHCTTELSAMSEANVVIVTIQTQYHEALIERMAPYLNKSQILIFIPSYMAIHYVKKYLKNDAPSVVEMTGPPVEGRIEDNMIPDTCVFRVGSRLKKNIVHIEPSISNVESIMQMLRLLPYPFEPSYSSIQVGLLNPNLILHTAGSILSIPRIENAKEQFCMYHEAYSRDNEGMMRVVEALDNEKNSVLNRLGFDSVPFLQSADFWGDTAMEKFLKYAESDSRANAPTSIHSRYITEDVSQGLVLLESVAMFIGVNTPLVTALINIANAALNVDFRKDGRTVERLCASSYLQSLIK